MAAAELPELLLPDADAWHAWLAAEHDRRPGVWLVLHKKAGSVTELTYAQALDEALCYGWIDGQTRSRDAESYYQRMTPRRPDSRWSARNVSHVERLMGEDRVRPAGYAQIERAKADGRWDRAYAGSADLVVPADLMAAISADPAAVTHFNTLSAQNRFAIVHRVSATKTVPGRAKSIARTVERLADGWTPHPQRRKE